MVQGNNMRARKLETGILISVKLFFTSTVTLKQTKCPFFETGMQARAMNSNGPSNKGTMERVEPDYHAVINSG